MYDCKDVMTIKMQVLRQLDVPEEALALYLPSEAPSMPIKRTSAIKVLEYLKSIIQESMLTLEDVLCTTGACPYCNSYSKTITLCNDCPYGNKFGTPSSSRHKQLRTFVDNTEWTPLSRNINNALTYLNKEIKELEKCGHQNKS